MKSMVEEITYLFFSGYRYAIFLDMPTASFLPQILNFTNRAFKRGIFEQGNHAKVPFSKTIFRILYKENVSLPVLAYRFSFQRQTNDLLPPRIMRTEDMSTSRYARKCRSYVTLSSIINVRYLQTKNRKPKARFAWISPQLLPDRIRPPHAPKAKSRRRPRRDRAEHARPTTPAFPAEIRARFSAGSRAYLPRVDARSRARAVAACAPISINFRVSPPHQLT